MDVRGIDPEESPKARRRYDADTNWLNRSLLGGIGGLSTHVSSITNDDYFEVYEDKSQDDDEIKKEIFDEIIDEMENEVQDDEQVVSIHAESSGLPSSDVESSYAESSDLPSSNVESSTEELVRLIKSVIQDDNKKPIIYMPDDTYSMMAIAWPLWKTRATSNSASFSMRSPETLEQARKEGDSLYLNRTRMLSAVDAMRDDAGTFDKDDLGMNRAGMLLSLSVFAVQITTLVLLGFDALNNRGRCRYGELTTATVRCAQIIAICISILSQPDITSSIHVLVNSLPDRGKRQFHKPNAILWHASNALRLTGGLLGIVVIFILIMKSTTVRDVLLNFAAAEFVSNLNRIAYGLAKWSYFGPKTLAMMQRVEHFKTSPTFNDPDETYSYDEASSFDEASSNEGGYFENDIVEPNIPSEFRRWIQANCRGLCISFLLLSGVVAWIILNSLQLECVPRSFYIQFGDDEQFSLGFASGFYKVRPRGRKVILTVGEVVYDLDDETHYYEEKERTSIRFCLESLEWQLTKTNDACADDTWLAKSERLDSGFQLPSSHQYWFANTENRTQLMEYIQFVREENMLKPTDWDRKGKCLVYEGAGEKLYGPVFSQTSEARQKFWNRLPSELNYGDCVWEGNDYKLLEGITSYHRPVYASRTWDGVAVLMSVGRRWAHVHGGPQYAAGKECDIDVDFACNSTDGVCDYDDILPNTAVSPNCDRKIILNFFPFTEKEKENIATMVHTIEWQLRSGASNITVLPDWNTLVPESNCTRPLCASPTSSRRASPTLFSDPFDIRREASFYPRGLSFHKTPNYPTSTSTRKTYVHKVSGDDTSVEEAYDIEYSQSDALGDYDTMVFEEDNSIGDFVNCDEIFSRDEGDLYQATTHSSSKDQYDMLVKRHDTREIEHCFYPESAEWEAGNIIFNPYNTYTPTASPTGSIAPPLRPTTASSGQPNTESPTQSPSGQVFIRA